MKILTGTLRGQKLLFKPNPHLRPTSDKVKKAVFDMLQGALEGAAALDLFSGTGALGFEALSNGAKNVTFVEIDRIQAARIRDNLKRLKLSDRAPVVAADVLETLKGLSKKEKNFDFIFVDPPYEKGLGQKTVRFLSETSVLKPGGLLVLECERSEEFAQHEGSLKVVKSNRYGDTRVIIYSNRRFEFPAHARG